MKIANAIWLVIIFWACNGGPKQVSTGTQTNHIGGTDSFSVQVKQIEKLTLLGRRIYVPYTAFAEKREQIMHFLPSVMERISANKLKLNGGLYLLSEQAPSADSQYYFVGVVASGTTGFSPAEIAYLPGGTYFSALTKGRTGKSLNLHRIFTEFLTNNNKPFGNLYVEKWLEYMEADMTKHEKIEFLYKSK